jgi:transposase
MLTREEDVEVGALKAQGWSISAIARHHGRDRKTIRSHLNGERAPGVRRRSIEDPFERFVPYVRQRLTDDPHLQLSTLLREVR